jgi:rRNA pseudouridine-1189 N-methylase Emg1 (Nep1/Mra1 family)
METLTGNYGLEHLLPWFLLTNLGLSMAFLQHFPWSRNSRPDITHQCLMALLDSPLNKAFVAGFYPL